MNSVLREMVTIKGVGFGGTTVVGKLRRLPKNELKKSEDDGWSAYSEAAEQVRAALEELCDLLAKNYATSFVERLLDILDFVVSREGLATAKAMCNGGMRAEQVAAALCELEDESAVMGARLILNELRGYFSEDMIEDGYIYSTETYDLLCLFSLVKNHALGAVFYGEESEIVSEFAELVSFPILFADNREEYFEEENAILAAGKGELYVSPSLDVIDEFYKSSEQDLGEKIPIGSAQTYPIVSLAGNIRCGGLLNISVLKCDEDRLFSIYRRYAELEGSRVLQVLLPQLGYPSLYSHIKAISRAAVYGRIDVLCYISSPRELREMRDIFGQCYSELFCEKREFEERIGLGAVIGNVCGVFLLGEIANRSDFVVIDIDHITTENVDEKALVISRVAEKAECDICENNKRIELMGDGEIIKEALGKVAKANIDKFFIISLKKK